MATRYLPLRTPAVHLKVMTKTLSEMLQRFGAETPRAVQNQFDAFVAGLRDLGIGAAAPQVGEAVPAFSLPDAAGHHRSLDGLLVDGPIVLSFNRGGWCPYCSHELRAWCEHMPALRSAGANLVVVTPEVGGRAALLAHLVGTDADLLCDVDHGVALASGLAFHMGQELQQSYVEWGLDLAEIYGSASGILPVPATFVIDSGGIVRFAHADPDFRIRAEPDEVMASVAALAA